MKRGLDFFKYIEILFKNAFIDVDTTAADSMRLFKKMTLACF